MCLFCSWDVGVLPNSLFKAWAFAEKKNSAVFLPLEAQIFFSLKVRAALPRTPCCRFGVLSVDDLTCRVLPTSHLEQEAGTLTGARGGGGLFCTPRSSSRLPGRGFWKWEKREEAPSPRFKNRVLRRHSSRSAEQRKSRESFFFCSVDPPLLREAHTHNPLVTHCRF